MLILSRGYYKDPVSPGVNPLIMSLSTSTVASNVPLYFEIPANSGFICFDHILIQVYTYLCSATHRTFHIFCTRHFTYYQDTCFKNTHMIFSYRIVHKPNHWQDLQDLLYVYAQNLLTDLLAYLPMIEKGLSVLLLY